MNNNSDHMKTSSDKDILFSQSVKAGRRIYYLDVKQNRHGDMFLSITESKRVQNGTTDSTVPGDMEYNFEKHKLFIYPEDFGKFIDAMSNTMRYIHDHAQEYPHGTGGQADAKSSEDDASFKPFTQDDEAACEKEPADFLGGEINISMDDF